MKDLQRQLQHLTTVENLYNFLRIVKHIHFNILLKIIMEDKFTKEINSKAKSRKVSENIENTKQARVP